MESASSRAFPGWRTGEIHRALNEPAISWQTEADLWRVGRVLGEREGTVPEDDGLMRRMELRGHDRGVAAGHARGVTRGVAETVVSILRRRGIEISPARVATALADVSADAVVEAALSAETEADFLVRIAD